MMEKLPNFITSEMTMDYLKPFLKKNGVSNVSSTKDDLLDKLNNLLELKEISEKQYWDFVVRAFQYGNNRIILTSMIDIPATSPMLELNSLHRILKKSNFPTDEFNEISKIGYKNRSSSPQLIYQKITTNDEKVSKIEQCYFSTTTQHKTIDGEPVSTLLRVFNWITIDLGLKRISIHTRNNGFNALNESGSLRGIHTSIIKHLSNIFPFSVTESIHEKRTLYNIYKEMTDTAEKTFREKVNSQSERFKDFYEKMCDTLDYDKEKDNIMLEDRIIRLFERGLIVQNFNLYSDYFEGKLGIIQRIVFCDGTGANVSAKVLDNNENISNYEIYFDTRDTLDKKQSLDKLWAKWYIKLSNDSKKFDYDVKFMVFDNFYVTHFIGPYLLEEVAEFVFSKFREFEF